MRPWMEAARVALVSQEKSTFSLSTTPVAALTFSAPKNFWRAATSSGLAPMQWSPVRPQVALKVDLQAAEKSSE